MDAAYLQIGLIKDALRRHGFTYQDLTLDGKKYTKFASLKGKVWLTSCAKIAYPFVANSVNGLCKDKQISYEMARMLKVSVPRMITAVSGSYMAGDTSELLTKSSKLVVKPANLHASKGLTLNIDTEQKLESALQRAWLFSPVALVQQQFDGEELRLTVLNGEIISILLRRTPRLVGNGKDTVRQLLYAENKVRAKIKTLYVAYPQLDATNIGLQGTEYDRVLKSGEILELSRSTMVSQGASLYEVRDEVHPTYIEMVRELAGALGHGFIAVDIMVKNYEKPLTPENYIFLEFNTIPSLRMYYGCRDAKQPDVVSKLAAAIEQKVNQ